LIAEYCRMSGVEGSDMKLTVDSCKFVSPLTRQKTTSREPATEN